MNDPNELKIFLEQLNLEQIGQKIRRKNWWKNHQQFYEQLIDVTKFLQTNSIRQRIWHILNDCYTQVMCAHCGVNPVNWNSSKNNYSQCCSRLCSSSHSLPKRQQTCMNKYGVSNPAVLDAVKNKIKQTCQELYGVDNYSKSSQFKQHQSDWWKSLGKEQREEINNKRSITSQQVWGTKWVVQSDAVKSKINQSMVDRYGASKPLQVGEFKLKQQQTMLDRYGRMFANQQHLDTEFIRNVKDADWLQQQMQTQSLRAIADQHGVSHSRMFSYARMHNLTSAVSSDFEKSVKTWLESVSSTEIQTNVKMLGRREVDIFIPERKLAIECNGLYWHCESSGEKHKTYHQEKTLQCRQLGIQLIHLLDTDWYNRNSQVTSRIANMLKLNTVRLGARTLEVREVDQKTSKMFLDQNHLHGWAPSSVTYGLYTDQDQLVFAISFGRCRYNKNFQWELIRLCSLQNTTVIGGAQKVFAHFVRQRDPDSVISYADLQWSDGSVYSQMGFSHSHNGQPGYWYTKDYSTIWHRSKFQKKQLSKLLENFDPNLSEWQNMQNNKWDRYWDSGNSVWHWKKK